jgi:signal transduction histidine kinase
VSALFGSPPPETELRPALRRLQSAWAYLLASAAGAGAWIALAASWLLFPVPPPAREEIMGAALFADMVLGVVSLAVLPMRHRFPVAVACVTTAATAVSVASIGPSLLAVVSMSSWRKRSWVAVTAAVSLTAAGLGHGLYHPAIAPGGDAVEGAVGGVVIAALMFTVAVVAGYYRGARRELLASLQDRALTAEREQTLTAHVARAAERTAIAREMHDVLAHRISLVALHAGALAFRDDLSPAQTTETATIIHSNSQLALTELREVLGVLRAGHADGVVELPQPTLGELPALFADAREAGAVVDFDAADLRGTLADVPETASRTLFRIVQESLTNARKHSPGEHVAVRLAGGPGGDLAISVRNPLGDAPELDFPSAGIGLAGLSERAQLAGGILVYGPRPGGFFEVQARVPWPA